MADVGCLVIDDGEVLRDWTTELDALGFRTERFVPKPEGLHQALQRAYQRVRRDGAASCVLAAGMGCDCALALAGQLPVDRLALMDPAPLPGRGEF
ncbi:MAG: hypothetical protein IJ646_08620, partial [Clostridia bacterium]|nr:hypothetical protein [Clostridia bacterium]